MANVQVNKLEKKARVYNHIIGNETIKTTCKLFGSCLIDWSGNFTGKCENCSQLLDVKALCIAQVIKPVDVDELKKDGKKAGIGKGKKGNQSIEVFESFVAMFYNGSSKASILAYMVENGLTEKESTSCFSKLNCITTACLKPMFKDSTVYQFARHYLVDSTLPLPVCDKGTTAYYTKTIKAWLKSAKPVEILERDKR